MKFLLIEKNRCDVIAITMFRFTVLAWVRVRGHNMGFIRSRLLLVRTLLGNL